MSENVQIALLENLPQLVMVVLLIVLTVLLRRPLTERLLPNLNSVNVWGVNIVFAKADLDAAVAQKRVHVREDDRSDVLARARWVAPVLDGARILWVDDHPEWNNAERAVMTTLGIRVDIARTTTHALALVRSTPYDVVITDMERDEAHDRGVIGAGDPTQVTRPSGLQLLDAMRAANQLVPTIFYVGSFDEARGVPLYAFGITDRPDHLLHLTMDVLERARTSGVPPGSRPHGADANPLTA